MSDSTWVTLQRSLRTEVSPEEYRTWFKPLRVGSERPRHLTLLAPNERFVRTLENGYRQLVDETIAGLKGPGFRVLFEVEDHGPRAAASAARGRPTPAPLAPPALDPKLTFDSFVVGASNQFAYAAARAVADGPGETYNPLFLYGGVGLGKTHLLQAIAHQTARERPGLRILYISTEQFVNELIGSIRQDKMPVFRERYRTIDALLVDDIQFLANKERTQEEFFHTFNDLSIHCKQIILTADSAPQGIPTLEERLRSRFAAGLIADIQPPDLETKVAILRRKSEMESVDLPDDVAMFIARQSSSNVRDLEGLLNRVLAFSSLTGRPLDIALAEESLRHLLPGLVRVITAKEIIQAVAAHYGLRLTEIKSRRNARQVSFPRQVAMYLCKQLTSMSYPEIGRQFNDKHHSTVMYAVDKIAKLRESDPAIDRTLDALVQKLS